MLSLLPLEPVQLRIDIVVVVSQRLLLHVLRGNRHHIPRIIERQMVQMCLIENLLIQKGIHGVLPVEQRWSPLLLLLALMHTKHLVIELLLQL